MAGPYGFRRNWRNQTRVVGLGSIASFHARDTGGELSEGTMPYNHFHLVDEAVTCTLADGHSADLLNNPHRPEFEDYGYESPG